MATNGPGVLARGPWRPAQVTTTWRADRFEPTAETDARADRAIRELRERGSPSHDGLSARLAGFSAGGEGLALELQPARWSLRLVGIGDSVAAHCVTRDADGRWLAGRRAPWVASWAGRWALGAGGAVEVGEDPTETLVRELHEEWSVHPAELTVEALVRVPSNLVMLVGVARLAPGAEVVPDHEHDAYAWWPADPAEWPAEADTPLRTMAAMLGRR